MKLITKFTTCVAVAALSLSCAPKAEALMLTWGGPSDATDDFAASGIGVHHADDHAVEIDTGGNASSGSDFDASGWYTIALANDVLTITWGGGAFLMDAEIYIKQSTEHYVDLVDWDGKETVTVSMNSDWSHADLNGTRGTSVPDGGATIALFGLALLGLRSARKLSIKRG